MFTYKQKLTFGLAILIALVALIFLVWPKTVARDRPEDLYPMTAFSHVHSLAVDVKDKSKVYIATHQGLYRLDNDSELYRIGKTRNDLMGFSPHPQEDNVFFSSGHPPTGGNLGIQKSTDSGMTWAKLSDGVDGPVDFHAMTIGTIDPNTLYGWSGASLQKSNNSGMTWEKVSAKDLSNVVSLLTHPRQVETVIATTTQGVMISKDGGWTWETLSEPLEGAFVLTVAIDYQYANHWLSYSDKLGLASSKDSGKSWQKVDSDFGDEKLIHIAFAPSDATIVYAVTDKHHIYKSSDGGNIWKKVF